MKHNVLYKFMNSKRIPIDLDRFKEKVTNEIINIEVPFYDYVKFIMKITVDSISLQEFFRLMMYFYIEDDGRIREIVDLYLRKTKRISYSALKKDIRKHWSIDRTVVNLDEELDLDEIEKLFDILERDVGDVL